MPQAISSGRITEAYARRIGALTTTMFCLVLCACSTGDSTAFLLLADPGKYEYHNCQQLATARKSTVARQKDLKELIDKAERGTAGVFVGAIAYRSDYAAVNQELKVIDATAREKNCSPDPAPRAPPPNWQTDPAVE